MQLRHSTDDLTIYEPIRMRNESDSPILAKTLHFKKISNSVLAKSPEVAVQDDASLEDRFVPLRPCANIGGYSTVFLPGASPSFIVKSSKGLPKVIGLQGQGVRGMSSFHTEGCERGFIYADSAGIARVTQLPLDANFTDTGLCIKKVSVGEHITNIAFHPPMESYVVACTTLEPFELPKDDDHHKEWAREHIAMKPLQERGILKVLSPVNWSVIDNITLDPSEVVMCMKTLNLEVSEETKERRMLIAVGTGVTKGEDLPTKGRIYVYDIVTVIPEVDRPETNKKLKLVAREEVPRGAVTAITEIGKQGLMLVAQGQKSMVRGLKEDGTLLPVAFMDMSCFVTSVRELPGTGLCLMSDAFKGVWFTGYTEEPFKLIMFGKSATDLGCLVADFLPDGKDLFIVIAGAEGDVHVLQFDPDRNCIRSLPLPISC
jgi:cleavage and polyadenylation specificity factor subunit 1